MKKIIAKLKELGKKNLAQAVEKVAAGVYDPSIFKSVFLAGGPGCFSRDTLIHTETGIKKISEIVVGEKIWTLSDTNNKELKEVNEVFKYLNTKNMVNLELVNGETIICTEDHEFKLIDENWKKACDLTEEDDIVCL